MITLQDKARGSFLGLAVGDALGTPTEGKNPDEILSTWGKVTDFLSAEQGGSDDTEYALFSAKILLDKKRDLSSGDVAAAWRKEIIKSDSAYKGAGFSEIIAIHNLKKELQPPESGQHLHSWSDGLAMRVAPFGIASAGDPQFAAQLASIDGSVSHSGEGIYSGQAVAAAVAVAMATPSWEKIVEGALSVIPKDSWTYTSIKRGIEIGSKSKTVWQALRPLYQELTSPFYFWSDVGPEAVGLAFGVMAAAQCQFEDAVLGGVNVGRDTDTIAAIAGAICGASNGVGSIPERWIKRISISRGICIKAVKGVNIVDIADDLAELAQSWRNQ